MYCIKCGNKLNDTDKFCSKCGNIIIRNESKKFSFKNIFTGNNRRKIIIVISLIILLLIGIGVKAIYDSNNSRTIMIYMVGADLESRSGLASRDLKDLDYEKIKKNRINVLLMAGGSKRWDNTYIDTNETSIYKLTEEGFSKVDQRNINNMGKSDNLSYFLDYCYKNSKTRKYDLLFWNHGGAVDGSEYDELSIMGDHLDLTEFKEALEKSPFAKKKLEVVSFRTCLNATLEVANVFKDYAEYLVASEEVTLGSSLDSALRFINEIEPQDKGISYGKKQINVYKQTIANVCNYNMKTDDLENYCEDITYSIIDLSKINEVNNNLSLFVTDLNKDLNKNYNEYSKIRANLKQYGASEPLYDMVDLRDFVTKFKKYSNNSDNLLKAFDKAIAYNFSNNDYSHGLSIYYPYNGDIFIKDYYDKITPTKEYDNFINNHYKLKTNRATSTSFSKLSNNKTKVKKESSTKADFEIELTKEQIEDFAKAQYLVFVDQKNGYHSLVYAGYDTKLEGNKLKAFISGKALRFADIDYDDISYWTLSHEKKVTEDYTDVEVVAILKRGIWNSDVVTITVRITDKDKYGQIVSITTDNRDDKKNKFSVFSPVEVDLNDYTNIEIANQEYKLVNSNGKFDMDFLKRGDGIYRGLSLYINKFHFIKENFDSDFDYYAVFRIFDTKGNEYYSDLTKIGG